MNSQLRIVYIVRNDIFDKIEYVTSDIEDAMRCVEYFSEEYISIVFMPYIIKRILEDDERILDGFNIIIKTVEWKRGTHNLFPSEFKEIVIILITLHKISESIISCLPRDILYYLFSLIDEGRVEIDTTKKLIE